MGIVGDLIYEKFVDIERYNKVREDFLDIYENTYDVEEVKSSITWSNSQIQDKALIKWGEASSFDPHDVIHHPVEILSSISKAIKILVYALTIVSGAFGAISIRNFLQQSLYEWEAIIAVIIKSIPFPIFALFGIYLYALSVDTDLVRRMNEELRIGPQLVNSASRDRRKLVSYLIWNTSLLRSNKIPMLGFLVLLNIVSSTIYNTSISFLSENMDLIYEHKTFRGIVTSAFSKIFRS